MNSAPKELEFCIPMKTRCQIKLLGLCLVLSACGLEMLRADCLTVPHQLVAWWRAEGNALDSKDLVFYLH